MLSATMTGAFIAVAAIALILGIAESILIIRMRKRWKPFDKMLLSLSVADQLVAIVTIIYQTMWFCNYSIGGSKISQQYFVLLLLSSEDFSLLHIAAITYDRLCAIKNPIKHKIRAQGKLPVIMIAGIWIGVGILTITFSAIMFNDIKTFPALVKAYSVLILALGVCFPLAYRYMLNSVLTRSANVHNEPKCNIRDVLQQSECKKERAMLVTGCLVVLSYIICMYPISIEMFFCKKPEEISTVTQLFLISNSILNPVVYFFKGYCDRIIGQSTKKLSTKNESTNSGTLSLVKK